jgi:hypothetical protein
LVLAGESGIVFDPGQRVYFAQDGERQRGTMQGSGAKKLLPHDMAIIAKSIGLPPWNYVADISERSDPRSRRANSAKLRCFHDLILLNAFSFHLIIVFTSHHS